MIKALKNKKGDSYIYLCVIVIFITMLVSVVILYMGLMAQVQTQKRDVRGKLDSFIADYATEMFDSLKQGDNYLDAFDIQGLIDGSYEALGFDDISDTEYVYPNGNCTITRPTVTTLTGNGFGVQVEYIAKFPIKWNGKSYADLEVPISVTSYYKFK